MSFKAISLKTRNISVTSIKLEFHVITNLSKLKIPCFIFLLQNTSIV